MTEKEAINKSARPVTIRSIKKDLSSLGVKKSMVLLVHSSLSSIGWVCGGVVSVILALESLLGDEGTLVMPVHSGDLSDPAKWANPPVPESWNDEIRKCMPYYSSDITPSRGMGMIPECFRKQKGVLRSSHPHVSFAAWGKYAKTVVRGHSLDYGLGDRSPLARIYDLNGYILLIGIGHNYNTSLHLSEYRADYAGKKEEKHEAPIKIEGKRQWVEFKDIKLDEDDFDTIGSEFIKKKPNNIETGSIGRARSQLCRQRDIVDFAVKWIEENRK